MKIAKIYSIIKIEDLSKIDFNQVFQTSANTIRKSLNGTQFVIKYDNTPSFISDGTVEPLQSLSHSECLELMATSEWTEIEDS